MTAHTLERRVTVKLYIDLEKALLLAAVEREYLVPLKAAYAL